MHDPWIQFFWTIAKGILGLILFIFLLSALAGAWIGIRSVWRMLIGRRP